MEWKMSEIKGKMGTAKHAVSKIFSLISGLGRECSSSSPPIPVITATPYELVKPLANYSFEAELKKAEAQMYWHMLLDRPK